MCYYEINWGSIGGEYQGRDILKSIAAFGAPVTRTYTLQIANDALENGKMPPSAGHITGWDKSSNGIPLFLRIFYVWNLHNLDSSRKILIYNNLFCRFISTCRRLDIQWGSVEDNGSNVKFLLSWFFIFCDRWGSHSARLKSCFDRLDLSRHYGVKLIIPIINQVGGSATRVCNILEKILMVS
jgi:hypothetical protein